MKIAVIGASKGIGKAVVEYALAQGHQVNALSRSPLKLQHPSLTSIQGDACKRQDLEKVIAGCDAVCICLGIPPTFKAVELFSNSASHIVDIMQNSSAKRLICVTGIGAGDSRGHGGFLYDRIINPLLLKTIYADKDVEEKLVRNSQLDWTIVRPGFLTNGPLTGKYRVLGNMKGVRCGKISRNDTAHFIVSEIEAPRHWFQTPLLTY